MTADTLKIALQIAFGGVAGALVNEWLRRRRGRVQPIPLIERVNRLVSPELKGFVLARVSDNGERKLEEIRNVREYQFTLRNTSNIHLHNTEIQFEFPAEDVEAWAERPVRSKTAPIELDVALTKPWKKGFRWRIPEFPASDSIEFTFRAIEPESADYEVALFNCGQVVIAKSKGEPPANKASGNEVAYYAALVTSFVFTAASLVLIGPLRPGGNKTLTINQAGCFLNISTSSSQVNYSVWPWSGPWRESGEIQSIGTKPCTVSIQGETEKPVILQPEGILWLETHFSTQIPELKPTDFYFGQITPTEMVSVRLYMPPKP